MIQYPNVKSEIVCVYILTVTHLQVIKVTAYLHNFAAVGDIATL